MSEGKHTLWSSEEISVLLAIWSSSEIQEKLERSKKKQIVYDEISQEMMNGGFNRSSEQIVNKLKKLRKEYRDLKMKPSKRGRGGHNKRTFDHGVMESILGDRPSSHFTRALNSATATVETNPESPVCSEDEIGSKVHEHKSVQQWTSKETNTLLTIWSSTEFQERLEKSKRRKRVYEDICQEMVNAGFTRTTEQIVNKIKKLKKELKDQKIEPGKSSIQLNIKTDEDDNHMDNELENLPANQLSEALNSASAMLEIKAESLSSAADLDDEVLNQPEPSLSSSQTLIKKSLGSGRIRKNDSNQELLDYLQTADERFMAHAKELNTAILNKMDEATNSMLGLLGRMVTLMEAQQENKP